MENSCSQSCKRIKLDEGLPNHELATKSDPHLNIENQRPGNRRALGDLQVAGQPKNPNTTSSKFRYVNFIRGTNLPSPFTKTISKENVKQTRLKIQNPVTTNENISAEKAQKNTNQSIFTKFAYPIFKGGDLKRTKKSEISAEKKYIHVHQETPRKKNKFDNRYTKTNANKNQESTTEISKNESKVLLEQSGQANKAKLSLRSKTLPEKQRSSKQLVRFDQLSEKCYTDYRNSILDHLLKLERQERGDTSYGYYHQRNPLTKVTSQTWAITVNWLIKLDTATRGNLGVLERAVAYFGYLLDTSKMELNDIQLKALACYWIAYKQRTGPSHSTQTMVKFCAEAYSPEKLVTAEMTVLKHLKFPQIGSTAFEIIPFLLKNKQPNDPKLIEYAARFLVCSGLLDQNNRYFVPSELAVAAVRQAIDIIPSPWTSKENKKISVTEIIGTSTELKSIELSTNLLKIARFTGRDGCEFNEPYLRYSQPQYRLAAMFLMPSK